MAQLYTRIVSAISKPPQFRSDFELTQVLPWFRKKTDIFRDLKTELLLDVLKNCQFLQKTRDDVFIKQGEKGDCFFITLSGQVSIYIKYAKAQDGDETSREQAQAVTRPDIDDTSRRCTERSKLGTYVCSLGIGESFGEVALITEDCLRTATIVADETMGAICIDRDLYNRSVKMVLEREFEEKAMFIKTNPFFSNWAPRYKKQLAMAFRKESYLYESIITKQGDPVTEIYFILTGEVKLIVNPAYHPHQYQKLFAEAALEDCSKGETRVSSSSTDKLSAATPSQQRKAKSPYCRNLPVCLLGANELIGDAEVLFDLNTHMQTAICNTRVEVLVLGTRHFERLIAKRNPQAIDSMRRCMATRITSRICSSVESKVPLYKAVLHRAVTLRAGHSHKESSTARATRREAFALPPRGPVIDLFGPGTVFYRIRRRAKAMEAKSKVVQRSVDTQAKSRTMPPTNSASYGTNDKAAVNVDDRQHLPNILSAVTGSSDQVPRRTERIAFGKDVFYDLSSNRLEDLEQRMGAWLGDASPRVTRLHRGSPQQKSQTEKSNASLSRSSSTVVTALSNPGLPFKPMSALEAVAVANDGLR